MEFFQGPYNSLRFMLIVPNALLAHVSPSAPRIMAMAPHQPVSAHCQPIWLMVTPERCENCPLMPARHIPKLSMEPARLSAVYM